ncbi:hypothetical protein SODALDRAFT_335593 [Sodiomyces alkalinus F11]|uniref:Rhodopsin domain-containing protein n=1 Tax=Sodiomyces alkalinus (strain CBS 110278 / VKM F-3762 / F11) TaxID=1314773 RepID=A0A3N2PPX7_SODAK|nr:hypothetical protein SODALDRAFT_335593 [Sodiomyces alkalinus F11]ROT36500.1 hypothetical protein SODALDRAFT_335593 [Sodiomyces alkalinus F11]
MSAEETFSAAYLAENKGPSILGSTIAVSIASTLFAGARLFVRGKILRQLHLDDYLIIISVLAGWVSLAMAITAVANGNGRHFDTLSLQQKQDVILWTIVGFPPGIISFGVPKLAVVALLTRIMNPSRWHTIFLWALTGLCNVALMGCTVILFAQCQPSRSQWNFSVPGVCWDRWILVHYAIFAGAFSAFVDLYLAIYPALVLAKLKLNVKKKIALTVALGIGSVSTVVAIYKCTRLPALASPDFSYDTSDLIIWTIVEGSTIIIASCIPILQPLVDVLFGKRALGSSSDPRYKYQHYGTDRSGPRNLKSDIDMPSVHRSGHHMHGKPAQNEEGASEYELTRGPASKSSQESILERNRLPSDGAIVRTDVFTVKVSQAKPGESDRGMGF